MKKQLDGMEKRDQLMQEKKERRGEGWNKNRWLSCCEVGIKKWESRAADQSPKDTLETQLARDLLGLAFLFGKERCRWKRDEKRVPDGRWW